MSDHILQFISMFYLMRTINATPDHITYRQISNIRHISRDEIVGAAPTLFSFSTKRLASMDWA